MTITVIRTKKAEEKKEKLSPEKENKYIPKGDLQSILIPIEKVIPLEDNPRKNDKTVTKLVKSIKDVGFRKPIILNENYEIKAGNTAYKAAIKLNMKLIPAIRTIFDCQDDEWKYTLSDNKIGESSEWNNEILKKLMDAGKVLPEVKNTGFTEKELLDIQELRNNARRKGSGDSNIKNKMLGKLLNNLTKYEVENPAKNTLPNEKNMKDFNVFCIEEEGEKMIVFHQKKMIKPVKFGKKSTKNNKKSTKKSKK